MLNRRHLRIKILQALYAFYQTDDDSFEKRSKELFASLNKIYDLYLLLLLSFSEIKTVAENKLEDAKSKLRPTEEDLNPNLKFVKNRLFTTIEESKSLRVASETKKMNWAGDANREMFKKIYANIKKSEAYFEHMNNGIDSFDEDMAFAVAVFKADIANSTLMLNFLEEKSIQWVDDIDLTCSMVIKTLKKMEENKPLDLMPLYKDKEDEINFINVLLRKSIMHYDGNMKLIDQVTDNWELDRIAKMDLLIMNMAISELMEFPNIPKKVTLNEYIEISKFYSTPKSSTFINGILDRVVDQLEKENKIKKTGRGLIN